MPDDEPHLVARAVEPGAKEVGSSSVQVHRIAISVSKSS